MNSFLIAFISLSISSSLVLAWTQTNLAPHLFTLLHWMGVKRNSPDFWPDREILDSWGLDDWKLWLGVAVHPLLADLLTCAICFSFHVSFWVSLVMGVLFLPGFQTMLFAPICALSFPIAIWWILKR